MNKGGPRKGSGRPPKYGKGVKLKVVRVPEHLAEDVEAFCFDWLCRERITIEELKDALNQETKSVVAELKQALEQSGWELQTFYDRKDG